MTLEVLEGGMRIEERILVFEADDKADRNAIGAHRVQPAAAKLFLAKRISEGENDSARLQPILGNVPELLDPDRKLRGPGLGANLQIAMELLREVAAHAVGKDGHLGAYVCARLERALRLAVLPEAAIARAHAGDSPAFQ